MFQTRKQKIIAVVAAAFVCIVVVAVVAFMAVQKNTQPASKLTTPSQAQATAAPKLKTSVIMDGLTNPWEVAFLPDGSMLVAERDGRVALKTLEAESTLFTVADVHSIGEGGLMGLEVDKQFSQNRFIYACFGSQQGDVRMVRWKLAEGSLAPSERTDIVTGMPQAASGRHSGCRIKMDTQNTLWVGTGDAAIAHTPQDPKSLGGKILRVNRDGKAVAGNLDAPFDNRIFSYGHRNTQAIALFASPKQGVAGLSVEHGPGIDDEVNKLVPGNFGWAPKPIYDEGVPMTDTSKFPDAVKAVWSSGDPTIAPSGASFVTGKQWQGWNGALAIAVLKGQQLRMQTYDAALKLKTDTVQLKGAFGRLRTAVQGPDGNLYLTTDNGTDDKVIKVTPEV